MRLVGRSKAATWKPLVPLFLASICLAGAAPTVAQAQGISGGVFEDVNYGGGAGRDSASAGGIARPNARVELYSAAGTFTASTVTGASGGYSFSGLAAGTYHIRVVNGSVPSSRTGYVAGTHLPVQTYRTDASTGTPVAVTDYVGGTNPTLTDPGNGAAGTTFNTATYVFTAGLVGTAQSVTHVVLGATDIVHVDFGFNFNTIVNTNDAGQGSLRQFLTNANGLSNAGLAIVGQPAATDVSIFMISNGVAHPGQRAGLPNQLDGTGTAVITPTALLPVIVGAQTSVDGTTQTANIGNTNATVLGTGGTVGVDALAIGLVAGPEVAIQDTGALAAGVEINANDVTVRGVAIYGFGAAAPDGGILIDNAVTGALVEANVIGTRSSSSTDPGVALQNRAGVYVNGADNGTIRNNLYGFNGVTGIYVATGSTGWTISGNEVHDSGTTSTDGDGITLNAASTNAVTGNRVTASSSQGIVVTVAGSTGNTITNNTVTGNGVGTPSGLAQSTGVTMRNGATSTTIDRNVISANYGAGIQINNGATGTVMTRNSMSANGTIIARNGSAATGQIGIDLNAAADNIDLGTAPFYTVNDAGDVDAGGNSLFNFPVLTTASILGGNLTISGFARPGSSIEFFISDADPTGFGEGQTYLFAAAEGSGADGDAGTGTYGPGAVNGLVQGTDTTNRFSFTVPLPGGVSVGTRITATATAGGETSEFSGVVQAANAAAVIVSPTSGLTTTEAGGTATFTVVLASQPTANVTVGLSSNDLTEGTVGPASVTFTTLNWNVAQTVTVTGVNDAIDDGDIAYSIVTAAATSTDPLYSGLDPTDVAVTNIDDDTVGITVNPTSGLTTTEAGGRRRSRWSSRRQPTANVTVGLSSNDLTEGTVGPASVTFTTLNWNVAQTVTVTGVNDAIDDGDIAYSIVTAAATSTDPLYSGLDPTDVSVTNIDDDTVGITVNPSSGLTTTEVGGTATFTVVLASQPTANVTVGLSSNDLTEGTVGPASVTFTTLNWNVAQTVTVTGVNDAIDDGDIAYSIVTAAATSTDPLYSGLDPTDVSVTNIDDDTVGITVSPTSGLTTTEAGGTATFTMVLNSQPTANVTVGLSSNDLTEGTVGPASVTFTTLNWNVAQTVTVTGVDDAVDDGDIAYSIVTAAATSTDPLYSGLDPTDVSVTNIDDDTVGITVNPTSGLTTTEAGGTATFTVVLNCQPTANVTVGLSSNDLTEGTVGPASVTFTTLNWNVAQTVTVTGVNDAIDDGDIVYSIVTAAATSTDPLYSGLDPTDVSVTNVDDDTLGITVSPTSGLTTTEVGGTATFTVVLNSQPTANVTVGLSSGDLTEGTVGPASVTFTTLNWNVAQTVTVTGVDDAVDDGDIVYTIVTAAATSADPAYNGVDPSDVSITNTDDDASGVTVNPTSGLTTTEAGGTATFTVMLDTQPTANVTVGLSSNDLTEGTVGPASVTFTTLNWNVAQTVTVTGVDDAIDDGDIAYSIVTAAATSTDPLYNGVDPTDVSVTNIDDDTVGITVNPTSGLTTTEAGGTATFTVLLNSEPTANVTVGLSSNDLTEGTVGPASVTFTTLNWNVAQTVTVTGADDAVDDGDIAYSIVTAAATSTDPLYSGLDPTDVSATNTDDDAAGVTVNPTSGLTTTEAGGTATFTVLLNSQPTANVTVGLSSNDLTEGTVGPASVTFTTLNWNVAQTVTVTGADDAVDDGDIAYSVVTAAATSADPVYNGVDPSDISVTNTDDDTFGVTVNPTSGLTTTEAGGTATFTVLLNSQPTANVTVGLSSNDLTEGTVGPASVTFTTLNWNIAQTVTVTGVDDALVDGNVVYTIVTAAAVSADPVYGGFDPSDVSVTNTDDDVAGVTVNPTSGLTTTEAGGTATFTVVLNSQPTANVTIGLSSSDVTEGTVGPASVTFTAGNWNVPQTVTVTGVDDALVDGSIAYTIVTAAAVSADAAYNGFNPSDVSVTNLDDDVVGVTVNPIAGLTTTEAGGTATFTVVLNSQPTANVTIGLSSSDVTEGTVAPASLTFTTANWNVAQTVTVTGVDDAFADGNTGYTIVTAAAASADAAYSGFDPSDVAATNTDDDLVGVTVNPTAGLTTTEAGGTATFTLVLNSQPTGSVTIGLTSNDLTEGTVAPASVTFTAANWNVSQTVTVTGVNDLLVDGNVAYTITTGVAASTDAAYNGFDPSDVAATNSDDDVAGVTVNPTSGLTTTEGGGNAAFTIVLTSQPTANVTIGLSSSNVAEGTVAPSSVTFTAVNWNVAQTVTVTGVDDALVDGIVAYTIITAAAVSADPAYAGAVVSDVAVINTDNDSGQSITLELTPEPEKVEVGEPVTFTLHVHNRTASNFAVLDIARELPPGFAILPGTATRDGSPIADTGGPQVAIGPLAALVDLNGNGRADPGESGYAVVRWRAVAGAGVFPGTKSAAATALSGCSTCIVSNRALAEVTVEESDLLARGTILGRVFEDRNRDGFQDRDEPGLFGATVALDDGTSVMTDAEGLFHVPVVDAGQRLLKLDMARLPYPGTPTTDVATVARVSGGLITSVRFGVAFDRDTLQIGSPAVRGLALITDPMELGVEVAGNAVRPAVVVNGTKVPMRASDALEPVDATPEVLLLSGTRLEPPAVFNLQSSEPERIRRWSFEIRTGADSLVRVFSGVGAPPARLEWNGELPGERVLQGGEVYARQLRLEYEDGSLVDGPRRVFGVDRHTSFGLTMTGDAFASGSADLTGRAMEALSRIAQDIRRSVGDTVFVEGHTDSVGRAAINLRLSRDRAEAAARYLVEHERIPRERLAIHAFGETRPIASNGTPEGRELNRRVEIFGKRTDVQKSPLQDVFRGQAVARVNGQEVPVDPSGRFAVRVPAMGDSLDVVMTDRSMRTTRARVRLPRLEILEPSGELLLPFGGEAPGARVDPREPSPIEETEVASLKSVERGRRAARLRLYARTDPGVRASVDGRSLPVADDGTFEADLPLHLGRNAFGIVLQDPAGVMTVGNVVVRALDHAEDGGEVIAVEKIPDMTVYMPPSGTVLSTSDLVITGETGVGNRVTANGTPLEMAPNGTFAGHIQLPEGKSRVTVEVEDPAGRRGTLERYVEVRSKRMFLVGLADGVVGGSGGGPRGESGTWTDGRIAYQLRGWISGKVLVTSAFDSQRRTWGSLFRDIDNSGRDRLMTNLDPDRLYPVFGDASVATYGAPGGGRFYVALEAEAVRASVGDFPIALDEVELAAFHRTLYGAQLQVMPTFLAKSSDPGSRGTGTSLKLFGAEAGHVHVRDVLEATGGTLYYLSHRDVIMGSVQAAISVHDRNTGLPLTRQQQIPGVDFIVKEVEGRILFNRPISSTSDDGSLLDGGQLGGNPVFIEVDYEASGDLAEKAALGGRLSQVVGPVQVGGTLVQDETGASPYTLRGTDARLRFGAHSWLGTEFAQSEGRASRVFGSADGGFSFSQFDTGSVREGDAWKVATEVDAGDWVGKPGRVTVGGFLKRVDEGFVSDSETGSAGSRSIGARAQVNSGNWGVWSARFDRDERFGTPAYPTVFQSDLVGAQWRKDGRRAGATAEFESRSADSTVSQGLGGVRFWYQLSDSLRTTVEHQQSISGPELGQTALGLEWRLPMGLSLEGRASDGTQGKAFRGGASFAVGGRRVYLREEILDGASGQQAMTVVGAQTPLGRMSRAYSEYQWLNHGGNYSATSVVGAEQGWRFSNGVNGSVYGEHGGRAGGSASLPHTTVALQLGYSGKFPLGISTRGEYRKMEAGNLERQYMVATHLDLRLVGGFSLLGDHRLSEALPRGPGESTRYEERSIGMAYRAPRSDRVEALARLTDLQDRRPAEPFDSLRATSGLTVAAVEVRMRLWPDLEWGAKGAARIVREGAGDIAPSDAHSMLWVSRVDYAFAGPFRLGVQYQQLSQREVGDRRGGWLQELTWDPQKHLRFGVGYNFTRVSGDEFDRSGGDADGWFVRAQSRY